MARALQADLTLVDGQLVPGVVVRVGRDGRLESVDEVGTKTLPHEGPPDRAPVQRLRGKALLPGFVNAHSHAFQRLLRGRTEYRAHGRDGDDFWSWRQAMYRASEVLDPDDMEAVCRFAFLEMKLAGFTHVVEFHYLHHGPRGVRYADPIEMSRRVLAAADFAGIGITLLRVAYQRGGPGQMPSPEQLRFVDRDPERYFESLEATAADCRDSRCRPVRVGIAAHSVRALDADYLRALGAGSDGRRVHAHASEQPLEIEQCLAETGRRPVELLADCGLLNERFSAVHVTHLGPGEASLLGEAGATAVICPTTERNLGDGLPNLPDLIEAGVSLAVGTDSHARIDPFAEMRQLEDGERLRTGRRNVLASAAGETVAPTLLAAAASGGARAAGLDAGRIEAGRRADLVAVDLEDPSLGGLIGTPNAEAAVLAALILGGHTRLVTDVWVGGRHEVRAGECLRWKQAAQAYGAVVDKVFG